MILLSAAGGRTGRALLAAMVARRASVRAFVRKAEQREPLLALGASDVVVGDMLDGDSVRQAAIGCELVVHVGPPMHAQEVQITQSFLNAASDMGAQRFLYYSVMHPFLSDVRHHHLKLQATEMIAAHGLPWSIIEPCRYMQHLEPMWPTVRDTGVHAMPFNIEAQFAVVDLVDLAEATAVVATDEGHEFATYELAGPQNLSQVQMAKIISDVLGRPVRAEALSLDTMATNAAAKGVPPERIEQMRVMNAHYDAHGFRGNPHVLQWLLGRPATRFDAYVQRLASEQPATSTSTATTG
jgi:uncharacterized protein YbjT (DUF2867 family)